jgi:nucleoside-diphosphate-sugar epimerase
MGKRVALVTGAGGFVGRRVVEVLRRRGYRVKAGIHRAASADLFEALDNVEPIMIDILNRHTLLPALAGVDTVYHFAALLDAKASIKDLTRVNVEGTKNIWECAAACSVRRALYCSSAAVYGLLARAVQPISEDVRPRAIEPYGRSKLIGESVVREIAAVSGLATVIIRPAAVFGPGDRTSFGQLLRQAAVSKLLVGGAVQPWSFSFAHVEDVAEAAVHLMHAEDTEGQSFNIAVNRSISFDEAFRSYLNVLDRAGRSFSRARAVARLSAAAQKLPPVLQTLIRYTGNHLVFTIWHPGFDITYSSKKLLATSFRFKWERFDDVLSSCLD